MIPINCFVVDDDEMDRLNIEDLLSSYGDFKLSGSFSNPLECMAALENNRRDVLFLDIDMPVTDGISFFKKLDPPPICVFITSYPEYALDTFEINNIYAVDYVVKPVKPKRFSAALNKVKTLHELITAGKEYHAVVEGEKVIIVDGSAIYVIPVSEIIYLEALANWTRVITTGKEYLPLGNLKNFLQKLPESRFLRVHRSYAVAKNKICKLHDYELQVGGYKIPVGKTYRKTVMDYLSVKH